MAAKSSSKSIKYGADQSAIAAQQGLQFQREARDENRGILNPYVQQGYAANNAIGALLRLNGGGTANSMGYGQLSPDNPAALGQVMPADGQASSPFQQAFQNYQNSTGYQFRLGEGMKSLNNQYAGAGLLNSGAAQKAAIQFGQNAGSQEFGNYLAQLSGQQQVGLSAGNALAGVGTNFANNAAAIAANNGNNAANGALAQAGVNNNLIGSLAGITGNAIGALSSYGGAGRNPYGIAGSGAIY
ncbi:hypothetical protein ASE65_10545 [Sphingomonas sp. Leaf16]|nr:hypothetical protein ASE65_10545 [Sphingomonas sp. Leaf16]KQN11049.1 hypothetical protein ASE81_11530 [Sphingomonas sp. Leaf29]KQN18350.1 hypothetical protein ASE83_11465 [Sphingomonas sp. Leaf32]